LFVPLIAAFLFLISFVISVFNCHIFAIEDEDSWETVSSDDARDEVVVSGPPDVEMQAAILTSGTSAGGKLCCYIC